MRMRPSADPRAPGIYQSFDPVAPPPLSIANTRIAGFVGHDAEGSDERADAAHDVGRVRRDLRLHRRTRTPRTPSTASSTTAAPTAGSCRVAHCAPDGRAARGASTRRAPSTSRSTTGTSRRSRSARSTRARGATRSGSSACTPPARRRCSRAISTSAPARRTSTRRAASRSARGADLRPRELRLRRDHRGRRQADQVERRETPVNRRHRAAAPTYLEVHDVRDPRRDEGSPRGVQGPADAPVVAQLRAARGLAAHRGWSGSRTSARSRRCRTTCPSRWR